MSDPWTISPRLSEVRGPVTFDLAPDAEQRAQVARRLNLVSLPKLTARLTLKPWMDGAELSGRFEATVEQSSAVSLEEFTTDLTGDIALKMVPAGSPNAPDEAQGEAEYDPEAADPPDVLDVDAIDLAAYVIEHLALEIDPFARKPGEQFEFDQPTEPESPFAVLRKLKGEGS